MVLEVAPVLGSGELVVGDDTVTGKTSGTKVDLVHCNVKI